MCVCSLSPLAHPPPLSTEENRTVDVDVDVDIAITV